jgi:mutator protein MutT
MIGRWWLSTRSAISTEHDPLTSTRFRDGRAGEEASTAVFGAVRDDGRVLLTQRAASKEFGLPWEFPGGSVLAGESSRDAAARELREETGIVAPPGAFLRVGRHREKSALVDLYVARITAPMVLRLDPSEVADAVWVTLTEVDRHQHAELLAAPWLERFSTLWGPLQLVLKSEP